MAPIDNFLINFFTVKHLSGMASTTRGFLAASVVFVEDSADTLKTISAIISILLFIGVIFLTQRGSKEIKRLHNLTIKDVLGLKPNFRPHSLKVWASILERMESQERGEWKLAVIEADRLFDKLLIILGYGTFSPEERFKKISPSQFSEVKNLSEAHDTVEKLLNEPGSGITFEGAERIMAIYKKAFEEIGLIKPEKEEVI